MLAFSLSSNTLEVCQRPRIRILTTKFMKMTIARGVKS